jgi:hypothetical protein
MHEFTAKYADRIQGVLSGFDRLVFRGSLRKIAYPFGMSGYLWANPVPLKNFGAHVNEIGGRVKEAALRCVQEAGRLVSFQNPKVEWKRIMCGFPPSAPVQPIPFE